MKKTYFIFVLLSLGMLVLAIVFAGANIAAFISLPAIIVTVFLPAFVAIGVFGLPAFFTSFRLAFHGSQASVEELKTGAAMFKMLGSCILLTGFITSMIGAITMLVDLNDKYEIGIAIAIAVMTFFYSLILFLLIALPFKTAYEKRLIETGAEQGK